EQYLAKFPQDAELRQHVAEAGKQGAPAPVAAAAPVAGAPAVPGPAPVAANAPGPEQKPAAARGEHPGGAETAAGRGSHRRAGRNFTAARNVPAPAIHARATSTARRGQSPVLYAGVNRARAE